MKKNNKHLIYIIAGEPSGDLHGANLIKSFNALSNDSWSFRGIGGPLMQQEGFTSIEDFKKLSIMGFLEVLKVLPFFLRLKKKTILDITKHHPKKIILIDYPGFNLKIAQAIKQKTEIKVYFYISPQLWAWKESRINLIKKYVDEIIVVFPFEVEWYKKRGVRAHYFGHPLIDLYKNKVISIRSKKINVGIFPGSRKQELNNHLPVIKETIKLLGDKFDNLHFIVGLNTKNNHKIIKKLALNSNYTVVINNSIKAFNLSDVALVASGTATLECAISKTPFVVIYKTSYFNWFLTSLFIKVSFASIVNILANKLIVLEFLQKKCNPLFISKELIRLIEADSQAFESETEKVLAQLGNGSSYKKTSRFILNS